MKFIISVMFLVICSPIFASEPTTRTVLALFSSLEGKMDETNIHLFAEMPLNYLGIKLKYWDIEKGLPPAKLLEGCRGVITWYGGDYIGESKALSYCRWLNSLLDQGLKLVVLDRFGVKNSSRPDIKSSIERVFEKLGLSYYDVYSQNPQRIKVVYKDSQMVEFERSLRPMYYQKLQAHQDTKVYLKLEYLDEERGMSDVVVTNKRGGFALEGYVLYHFQTNTSVQWHLNPFEFFAEAFSCRGWPCPETSLLNGNRIFLSTIDGDGFRNVSEVDNKTWSAMVIRDQILARYSWPITVSLVVGEILPVVTGSSQALEMARSLFQFPHVKAGCHGHAHPFDWENKVVAYPNIPGYQFSLEKETTEAIDYLNQEVFSPQKPNQIYLWTGDCQPPEEAISLLENKAIPHMNGGNPRFDALYPSFSNVSALSRPVGLHRQTYACAPNENHYTQGWKTDFHSFVRVIDTWKATDEDFLLKPVHLYYHFYIGEKVASLEALHEVYQYLEKQTLSAIYASEYVKIVEGFFQMEIEKEGEGYRLRNAGHCRTLRFNNSSLFPHMEKSQGVIGFLHRKGHLYIYLDEQKEHLVNLTKEAPSSPYLVQATTWVSHWRSAAEKIQFQSRGIGKQSFTIGGLKGIVRVTIENSEYLVDKHNQVSFSLLIKEEIKEERELIVRLHSR